MKLQPNFAGGPLWIQGVPFEQPLRWEYHIKQTEATQFLISLRVQQWHRQHPWVWN
jgi:hypothetical protein